MSSILDETELRQDWYSNIKIKRLRNYLVYTPENFNTALLYPNNIDFVANDIKNKLAEFKVNKIALEFEREGFNPHLIFNMNSFVKMLISTGRFDIEDFVYIVGIPGTSYNKEFYKKIFRDYPTLEKLSVEFVSRLETNAEDIIKHKEELFDNFQKNNLRTKKFICFNGACRVHRTYLLAKFLDNDLLVDSLYSFNFAFADKLRYSEILEHHFQNQIPYRDIKWAKIKQTVFNNIDKLPFLISHLNRGQQFNHESAEIDFENYANTYFSIITETSFITWKKEHSIGIDTFDNHFFSEKTWKILQAKHPFILVSNYNILKSFRELGYKTFHPYIDESYDDIQDDELRLESILTEVNRLCKMSLDNLKELMEKIDPIVRHNYEHLKSRNKEIVYLDRKSV